MGNIELDDLNYAAVFSDCGLLGSRTALAIEGEFIGDYASFDEALKAFDNWCAHNNYWPSIYYVDDHGGISLVNNNC